MMTLTLFCSSLEHRDWARVKTRLRSLHHICSQRKKACPQASVKRLSLGRRCAGVGVRILRFPEKWVDHPGVRLVGERRVRLPGFWETRPLVPFGPLGLPFLHLHPVLSEPLAGASVFHSLEHEDRRWEEDLAEMSDGSDVTHASVVEAHAYSHDPGAQFDEHREGYEDAPQMSEFL